MSTRWSVAPGLWAALAAGVCGAAADGWRMDLKGVTPPRTPAVGSLGGKPFRVDRAVYNPFLSTLQLQEGREFISNRSFKVFLFLKDKTQPDGKGWDIRPHYGSGPHIHRNGGRPEAGIAPSEYSMLLEFGKRQGKKLPGVIYLCLPDRDWIAGSFTAEIE